MSRRCIPRRISSSLASFDGTKKALDKFLDIDCKSGRIDINLAHQFFNQMLYLKPRLPTSCFSRLLAALVKCEHFSVAISFYKRLNLSGLLALRSKLVVFCVLVNCYSSMKLGSNAGYSVFGLILKNGYRPEIMAFSSLVKGLCLEERIVEAVGLLSKMHVLGCAPNIITYNTIINTLCKTGNLTTALELHRVMVSGKAVATEDGCRLGTISYTLIDGWCIEWPMVDAKGRDVRFCPDVVSYNCLIEGLCRLGKDEDAESLLNEMVRRGIHPNVVTYNVVINTLCKKGKVEEAMGLHEMMILRRTYPSVVTYSTIVDGYCSIGKFEAALNLYRDMNSRGIYADNVTITALLKGLFLVRKVGDAMSLFRDMKKMDVSGVCGPNEVTYTTMIDGLCKEGHVDMAEELFLEMQDKGITLDNHVYSCLIDGLCKKGHVEKAQKLFLEMLARGVSPNVIVYSALIDGLCKKGDMHKAEELFMQMRDNGITPTVTTYTMLVDGHLRCGNVKEANTMLENMIGEGILPNAMTFAIVLNNLGQKGEQAARNVIALMERCGYVCDVASYNTLIHGYCKIGMLEDAYNLLAEMEAKACSPNIKTYSTLIQGFAHAKESARVKELTQKMHNIRISSNLNTTLALLEIFNMDDRKQ